MKTFDAIYYTADETDDGYRVIEAAGLQDAKDVLRRQMAEEGKTYRLDALTETQASFEARRSVRS